MGHSNTSSAGIKFQNLPENVFFKRILLVKNVVWLDGSWYRKSIQKKAETLEMEPNRQHAKHVAKFIPKFGILNKIL